jgi:predicted nucleic acid-binding protein
VIVVSNSSPLIALSRIGRLDLLASFYKRILVPAEVYHEVTVDGRGLPGAEEVRKAVWVEVAPRTSPMDPSLEQACQGLGAGERGAILLAKSLPADLVLLDESKARCTAKL